MCQARSLAWGLSKDPMPDTLAFPSSPPLPRSMSLTQIFPEQEVKTEVTFFPGSSTMGFISEAANLVLLRLMAWRQTVPSNARFLALDTEGRLCYCTYVRGLPGWGTWPGENQRGHGGRCGGRKDSFGVEEGVGWGPDVGLPRAGESKVSCVRRSHGGRVA